MWDEAIGWAEEALGAPVSACERLTGGMTSTMLALTDETGRASVLRLMTEDPWRAHGGDLTAREHAALEALAPTDVPAPTSLALDAEGAATGVAAHLTTRVDGSPRSTLDLGAVEAMARMLATVHAVRPAVPFRPYQSWAWEAKRVVPDWTGRPESWQRAFDILATDPPAHEPTLLHRDFSHRNLLWEGDEISGVVDWVETSTGPAWLDAGHAATNIAIGCGAELAEAFLAAYADRATQAPVAYWLVMDAVGFLPAPGRPPMFGSATELARLDAWLDRLVRDPV